MKKTLLMIITILNLGTCFAQFSRNLDFSYNKIEGQFSNLLALDIYSPTVGNNLPVMVFVHGGGWTTGDKRHRTHQNKRDFFIEKGFIFISINYRLTPEVNYPTYPQDVAQALVFVFNWIGKFNGDNNKVYLMGHSAGAHLAALVATDDQYLEAYNYSPNDIKAVILLDGAGYDIPAVVDYQSQNNNQTAIDMYKKAFGEDGNLWHDASPINHVSATTPPHILFYVDTRQVSYFMSNAYFDKLNQHNSSQIIAVSNSSHYDINNSFGAENDLVSIQALAFISDL